MSEVLRLLANGMNRDVLGVLAVEPSFPRRIASLLGYAESEVSRRLRALEKAGLLEARWERQENNVKVYSLARARFEMRITPSGILLEGLEDQPQASTAPSPMPVPATQAFVGRADVLERMEGAPVTLLEGLPGIGKTSVMARFARDRDPLWITCRGAESLTWLANQAALHFARGGDRGLLDVVEAGAKGAALAAALLDALDRPGRCTVLDDVHEVKEIGARAFIDDALRRFSHGTLLLAGRERVPHAPRDGVQSIRLEGLLDDETAELLRSRGFDVDAAMLARVRDEVGGHPLALHLLMEAAASTGGLDPLLDRKPERELTDYLLEEIDAGLSDAERTALSHASLFGHTFYRDELEALCGRRLEGSLLALRRRNLVLGQEDGMRLHEVVRNFYYSRLQDRPRLHRKAAEQCQQRASVAGHLEAMHHLLQAGDRDAVLDLVAQDLDLRDFDFVDSGYHRLYREMLELFSKDDVAEEGLWAQILDERGDLEYHAGDPAAARDLYRQAAGLFAGDGARCADLAWKQALCLHDEGDRDAARLLCESTLEDVEEETTRRRLEELHESLVETVARRS